MDKKTFVCETIKSVLTQLAQSNSGVFAYSTLSNTQSSMKLLAKTLAEIHDSIPDKERTKLSDNKQG